MQCIWAWIFEIVFHTMLLLIAYVYIYIYIHILEGHRPAYSMYLLYDIAKGSAIILYVCITRFYLN